MKFQFRLVPFIAMSLAVVLGVSLGQWQTRRANEKQEIETKLAVRERQAPVTLSAGSASLSELEYRKARVQGEFARGWPLYLDNRPYRGVPGFYVLMPLKITGSDTHVLVARGWIKRDIADRARLPLLATPQGTVAIEGIVRRAPGRLLQLGKDQELRPHAILQNLDIAELRETAQLDLLPFLLEQTNEIDDGLIRDWPRPSSGADKHWGYAFQWYALAATAFIFFIVTGIRRAKE